VTLSNWNRYLETRLAANLNGTESRLLDAIARETLGWNRTLVMIGDRQLQDRSRIDRRNFTKARQRLLDAGLIAYTPGKPGRGSVRGSYLIKLGKTKSVNSRSLGDQDKSVNPRALTTGSNERQMTRRIRASNDAHLRVSRVKSTGKPSNQELVGRVIESYSAQGGNLEKPGWRDILAQHAARLLKAGNEADLIVTAAGILAREADPFPGNLTKLVKQIQTEGMPCKHRGDLRGLSKALLAECGCPACLDRIAYCKAHGLETAFLQPLAV